MTDAVGPSPAHSLPDWFGVELAKAQMPLFAYVRNLMAGSADAWDVLQDANQVICQKAASVKSASEFLPWAYGIARFKVLHYRQRAARDRLQFSPEIVEQLADRAAAISGEFADRVVALESCLKKLPERQQQIFSLRYSQDMGLADISRRVGRRENAVAAALYRARAALAHCIKTALAGGRG